MEEVIAKTKENSDHEVEFYVLSIGGKAREGSILLNPGRLTVELCNEKKVFRDEELKSITLENGILKIIDKEYKWKLFGNKGNKIEIEISQITNSQLFLELINLWLKIKE